MNDERDYIIYAPNEIYEENGKGAKKAKSKKQRENT